MILVNGTSRAEFVGRPRRRFLGATIGSAAVTWGALNQELEMHHTNTNHNEKSTPDRSVRSRIERGFALAVTFAVAVACAADTSEEPGRTPGFGGASGAAGADGGSLGGSGGYTSTCKDGIKNGTETGIDCGGAICPDCPIGSGGSSGTAGAGGGSSGGSGGQPAATCNDGVKNGDETYKDCGGSCPVCWFCKNGVQNPGVGEEGIDCGGPCPAACPTCNDGVKNGDETYKDCGGSCGVCWFCKNGKHNPGVGEKGVDCGGPCPAACPTCKDGKKNGNETGIDCGGSCPACSTCKDGKKNGNETGIDCGGSCPPCQTSCYDKKKNGNETGIDCGGSCLAVGRFCPVQCPTGPVPPQDNWIVWPDPKNPCVVPYTDRKAACPSLQASIANCLAVPMLGGSHDPRRDCLIRKIRTRGNFETGIAACLKPSYNQQCMVNLAVYAGVPQSCP